MSRAIFLDDGGVLSDNRKRAVQWQRHVGDFLSREVGGDAQAWGDANRIVAERLWAWWLDSVRAKRPMREAIREYDVRWLREMAERAGRTVPDDDDALVALTRRASRYVTERVHAFYPAVGQAVRTLRAQGHTLHTASGALECDLDGYLRAESVRDLFGTLYGADIVETWKGGPEFYEAVFAHAGVEPHDAIVVDDNVGPIEWARANGAKAFLMDRDGTAHDASALRDLNALTERL